MLNVFCVFLRMDVVYGGKLPRFNQYNRERGPDASLNSTFFCPKPPS
jgi:hypothetical protein